MSDEEANEAKKNRAPNVKETAIVKPVCCRKCGSTERSVVAKLETLAVGGTLSDGTPYTHVVRRRVRCDNPACGQLRIEKSFENRVGKGLRKR